MADNINFKDAFFICDVIEKEVQPAVTEVVTPGSEDGKTEAVYKIVEPAITEPALNIPFDIFHQTIVEDNKNHYCYLTRDLIGKKVLVYSHVKIEDEPKVKEFAGYLGEKWEDAQKGVEVAQLYTTKKEDVYATTAKVGEIDVVSKYDGVDSKELAHPYLALDVRKA